VGLRAGLDRCGKSRLTGIRSPDRPARRQSLYRLRYPAHIQSLFLANIVMQEEFMSMSGRLSVLSKRTEEDQKGILFFFCTQYVKWFISQAFSRCRLNGDLGLSEPLEKSSSVSVRYIVRPRTSQGLVDVMTVCWEKPHCAFSLWEK